TDGQPNGAEYDQHRNRDPRDQRIRLARGQDAGQRDESDAETRDAQEHAEHHAGDLVLPTQRLARHSRSFRTPFIPPPPSISRFPSNAHYSTFHARESGGNPAGFSANGAGIGTV